MSDMVGLSWAVVSLAFLLAGGETAGPIVAAALAGLAAGVRVQTALLTLPALGFILWQRGSGGLTGRAMAAVCAGGLAWAIPLVWLSGGISGYLTALGSQAGEDLAWVDMLWATPTPRHAAQALTESFVHPWSVRGLAAVVGVLAVLGCVQALRRERRALALVATMFAPYTAFHLLLQETVTVRYALPLVVPVAWLASRALAATGRAAGSLVGIAVVAACLIQALPAAALYARQGHPAFLTIADMVREAKAAPPSGVYAHYALYRSLQAAAPPSLPVVPPALGREWLGPVDYWRTGGSKALWFLADPRRTDLELVDPRALQKVRSYPWDIARRAEMGGARPVGADWYRLSPPAWMVGAGWSLTPEAGGRVRAEGNGLEKRPIEAYLRRHHGPSVLVLGGYYLGPPAGAPTQLAVALDGVAVDEWTHDHRATGPAFLRIVRLPNGVPGVDDAYATLRVSANADGGGTPGEVAIRQFDVQPESGALLAFGSGWYEDEYNPATGMRWRWTSDSAELFVMAAGGATLVVRGESPVKYYGAPPLVRLRVGGTTLAELRPDADFEWRVPLPAGILPAGGGTLTLTLDRVYLPGPAEGTSDTRRLGLRTFSTHLEVP
jgi:hypothetical protein